MRQRLVAYSDQQSDNDQLKDLKIVRAGEGNTNFVIETTQDHLEKVEGAIKAVFGRELSTNKLTYDPAGLQRIPQAEAAADTAAETSAETAAKQEQTSPAPPPEDQEGNAADPALENQPNTNPDEGARRNDLPPTSLIAQANPPAGTDQTATDADSGVGSEPANPQTAADPPATPANSQPAANGEKEDPDASQPQAEPLSDPGETTETPRADSDSPGQPAGDAAATDEPKGPPADQQPADQQPAAQPGPVTAPPGVPQPPTDQPATPLRPSRFAGGTKVDLKFANPINQETLLTIIKELVTDLELGSPDLDVANPTVLGESAKSVTDWTLRTTLSEKDTQGLLESLQTKLQDEPVFGASTNIGGQVAGDTTRKAFTALFASLLCIVGYIWIRFQRVTYGLAAVVALVHDVLVTLGVIALSAFVVDIKPVSVPLLLEEFKLSLPMLAAFLTIIGYSLNDTIVVFDRIREVRGKSPQLTESIINTSINQTLSRTLLTSLTTFIVVLILYVLGGPGIHGFAFALVVGVVVGTYSSIFVASPVLMWMSRQGAVSDTQGMLSQPTGAPVAG